jgi:hypothetical protein
VQQKDCGTLRLQTASHAFWRTDFYWWSPKGAAAICLKKSIYATASKEVSQSRAQAWTDIEAGTLFPKMNTEPEAVMHNFWVVAAAAVLVCGEALAAEGPAPENGEAAVGVGVLCNTSRQAEQFVSLRGKGAAPAMQAVNSAARDGHACGIAAVAYIRDRTVGTVKLNDRLVQIVRINVVAGFTGSGWERATADMTQYAVLEGAGESVWRALTKMIPYFRDRGR